MAEEQANKRPMSNNTKAIVFFVFVILAFIAWGRMDSGDASTDRGVPQGEAWVACKNAVKEQTRNPATVDFSLLSTSIDKASDGGYDIAGSLTAKNDFGVEKEIAFSCQVDSSGVATANLAQSN